MDGYLGRDGDKHVKFDVRREDLWAFETSGWVVWKSIWYEVKRRGCRSDVPYWSVGQDNCGQPFVWRWGFGGLHVEQREIRFTEMVEITHIFVFRKYATPGVHYERPSNTITHATTDTPCALKNDYDEQSGQSKSPTNRPVGSETRKYLVVRPPVMDNRRTRWK